MSPVNATGDGYSDGSVLAGLPGQVSDEPGAGGILLGRIEFGHEPCGNRLRRHLIW